MPYGGVPSTLPASTIASVTTPGTITQNGGNGAQLIEGFSSELITLNTGGTTTNSVGNLLPANSQIIAVVFRVTTTITTATAYSIGDATTAARFQPTGAALTAGTTGVGQDHMSGAVTTLAAGPTQAAAAPLRITTDAPPGAGAIRVTVFWRRFVSPTS